MAIVPQLEPVVRAAARRGGRAALPATAPCTEMCTFAGHPCHRSGCRLACRPGAGILRRHPLEYLRPVAWPGSGWMAGVPPVHGSLLSATLYRTCSGWLALHGCCMAGCCMQFCKTEI
jgi:hypothetical protein